MARLSFATCVLILCCLSSCGLPAAGSAPVEMAPATPANSPSPTRYQPPRPAATKTLTPTVVPTAVRTSTPTITSTPSPSPADTLAPTETLPASARIKGVYGYGQLLPLSCEARSAADWARHFGVKIRELEFMARLPKSINPEEGFVGSPNGGWGLIPPDAYGVHAPPVAAVLREYGARASAVKHMAFDDLRVEIAAGRPVIVWVTGHVAVGKPSIYRVDGQEIVVARYEHTVIVIGYDPKYIEILDGKTVYKRPVDTFLKSWAVLENMAIMWEEEPKGNGK